MKVSSGKFGGRKLLDNPYSHIRPTSDIVKQAIFNKLSFQLENARVLDLFCGTGALGIEALSRGASEVIFVDSEIKSVNLTKKNLQNLNLNCKVVHLDYNKALAFLKGQKFDVILVDPPYQSGFYQTVLEKIFEFDLLSDDGVIVCEQEKTNTIKDVCFEKVDEKIYGIKKVSYFKKSAK